jgi:pimeloyl-ACP methyl ester carboxylesterase
MKRPIVMIHGLWMTPRCWDRFREHYEKHGYRVLTPPWPRERGGVEDLRRDPSPLNGLGVREIVNHFDGLIRSLKIPPILMGHSFGGLVVQQLLDRGLGAVGVAIDPAPPRGIFSAPRSVMKVGSYALRNPKNYYGTVRLTYPQFRYVFANNMNEEEARAAYERDAVPTPGRPFFEAAFAPFNPKSPTRVNLRNPARPPLLIIGGAEDHAVPAQLSRKNFALYKNSQAVTDYKEFPGRCHLILSQKGWQEVAEYALNWAEAQCRATSLAA